MPTFLSQPVYSNFNDIFSGTCTKIEYTETVDESSLMSNSVAQKGAIVRIGEHLYGFEGIRDLSLKAAADVDRFFGREANGNLVYETPYHFLNEFVEDYTNSFYKSTLSRSAHDLSEWKRKHSDPPIIAPSLSYGDLHPRHETVHVEKEVRAEYDPYKEQPEHDQVILNESRTFNHTAYPSGHGEHSFLSRLTHDMSSSAHLIYDKLHNTLTQSGSDSLLDRGHYRIRSLDGFGTPKLQDSAPFECNHHLVRDFEDPSSEGSTALVCDADVQPIAPMLQSEGSIRSMTSSRHSMVDHISIDHELSDVGGLSTPVSTYSDAVELNYDPYQNETRHVISEDLGTQIVRRSRESLTGNTTFGSDHDDKRSTMTITKTMFIDDTREGSDISDSETLRPQHSIDSHSDSDATIVANELETLQRTNELQEAHLHAHVTSIPKQHSWERDELARQKSNDEAEALLRDVHSTHQALQEQIHRLSNPDVSKYEIIYDTVAKDPEHIYDAVADAGLHHAHGALVLSEPVKRPLAVTPPVSDDVAADQSPYIEELHYAESDISKHQVYHDNEEHIYAEIGPPPPAPPKIGEGVTDARRTTEPEYA
ncbi:hypothetical protein OSTOST_09588, partial [Ostertagia ostertagi]